MRTRTRPFSRRRLLQLTAGTVAGFTIPGARLLATQNRRFFPPIDPSEPDPPLPSVPPRPGEPALPIPQRLEGHIFNLDMRLGTREFLPGLLTPTKGYNGDFLGPTLVPRTGASVTLNVTNRIGVTTSTHWHGMHVPAVMDGGPHQTIQIGQT